MSNKMDLGDRLIVAAIAVTPVVFLPIGFDFFYMPKLFFLWLVALGLAVFALKRKTAVAPGSVASLACLGVYLSLVAVSAVQARDVELAITGAALRQEGFLTLLLYGYLLYSAARYYRSGEAFVKPLLFTASVVAVYGLAQYYGFDPFPRDFIREGWRNIAFSTIGNPNFLGSFLVLLLPMAAFRYINRGTWIDLALAGLFYSTLLATHTRGTWLGAWFALIVTVVVVMRAKLSLKRCLVYLALLAVITTTHYVTNTVMRARFTGIPTEVGQAIGDETEARDRAGSNRIFVWRRTLSFVLENPVFGLGPENFASAFSERHREEIDVFYGARVWVDRAHNEYLHIAVSSGIPALVAYLALLATVAWRSWQRLQGNPLLQSLFVATTGYQAQAFFNISVASVAYLHWLFLGLQLALVSQHPDN